MTRLPVDSANFPVTQEAVDAYLRSIGRLTAEIERLRAALAGEMGLVELLTSRDDLRADRDEILSNHRHIEAREALRGFG